MPVDIFLKIMGLIEKESGIPILSKHLDEWLVEKKENQVIYDIYVLASKGRLIESEGK